MKGSALPIWISIVVLALAAYGGLLAWRTQRPEPAAHPDLPLVSGMHPASSGPPLTEFTLTERSGLQLDSRSLQGEVWVGSVFFTSCMSACLELNKSLAEIQRDPRFRDVKFVSITCDPSNDTASVLTSYANRFGADPKRWFFCTGKMDYIERIGRDFLNIAVQGVTHSNRAVIFDRTGKNRGGFIIADPRMAADRLNFESELLKCLAEQPPAKQVAESQPQDQPADTSAPGATP